MVVFIHGSGPNDRDETILENKPFKDIADGLLTYGISSYRFDKRTKVAPLLCLSPDFNIDDEVTDDILNILHYFNTNDTFKTYQLYIIGHSLGAMMSPRIALKAKGELSGLVMMAGNARPLDKVLITQLQYLDSINPSEGMKNELEKIKKQVAYLNSSKFSLSSPEDSLPLNVKAAYWQSLKDYNQISTIKEVQVPILILQGEKDYQVTMEDYHLWQKAIKSNPRITMKSYHTLNHLFMENKGIPSPKVYQIKQIVPYIVINDIANWILKY